MPGPAVASARRHAGVVPARPKPAQRAVLPPQAAASAPGPGLKRGCACGGGCPRCSPPLRLPPLGPRGDRWEREADAQAAQALDTAPPTTAPTTATTPARAAPWHAGTARAVAPVLQQAGELLPEREQRDIAAPLGLPPAHVRIHRSPQAARAARALHASAFAWGEHIAFAGGRWEPDNAQGRQLLAHELAHVAQAHRGAPFALRRQDETDAETAEDVVDDVEEEVDSEEPAVDLNERLDQEFKAWGDVLADAQAAGDFIEVAYISRLLLLFQGVDAQTEFADEDELEDWLDTIEQTALDENATLGEFSFEVDRLAPGAFPLTWSERVREALDHPWDEQVLADGVTTALDDLDHVLDRVPDEVGADGLPVPFAEAAGLQSFQLRMRHVAIEGAHVVKEVALAARAHAVAVWRQSFATMWHAMAEHFAEEVANGEMVVDIADYDEFVAVQQAGGLTAISERLGSIDTEDLLRMADDEVAEITGMAFVQALASTWLALIPAFALWMQDSDRFDVQLLEVDDAIAAEAGEDRILRAMQWAYASGYFGDAAAALLDGLWAEKWKILAVGGALIGVQFIPGLNVAVDALLVAYAGVDAMAALASLEAVFSRVATSSNAVELQRNSAAMAASMEGDGLRLLLDLLAIGAAGRAARARADELVRAGVAEDLAMRRALAEMGGPEAAALREVTARGRISAGLDPRGLLTPVLDAGVGAELVEQALISGLTPERIVTLFDSAADATAAARVIEYAGTWSAPVENMLSAGMPARSVATLAGAEMGLVDLTATADAVATMSANGAAGGAIDTMISHVSTLGAGGARRLTPRGIVSVEQAAGADGFATIARTLELQAEGSIAGFDDWVAFSITRLNKTDGLLRDVLLELREAERLLPEVPAGGRVRIGNDLHGGGAKSLDLVIEDAAGNAVRRVDVTSLEVPYERAPQLTRAIKHVAGKITATTGAAEGSIAIELRPRISLGNGRRREFEPGGAWRIVERDGRVSSSGHVLTDLAQHLNRSLTSITEPPVFNLVHLDGSLIGSVERVGGSWRVRP